MKFRFIRNGSGRAYLPGTSVKGAIRTAVLWKMLNILKDRDSSKFESILQNVLNSQAQNYKNRKDDNKHTFADSLIGEIFQAFVPKEDIPAGREKRPGK